MATKMLSVLSTLLLIAATTAPNNPPALDSTKWRICIPPDITTGAPLTPLPFFFRPEFQYNTGAEDYYIADAVDEDGDPVEDQDGNPIYCKIYVPHPYTGERLEVWNSDSDQWTVWEWNGDWYDKVGGTKHERCYVPFF